jgi:hypothetical protein
MSDSEELEYHYFISLQSLLDSMKTTINSKFADLTNLSLPSNCLNVHLISDWMNRQIQGSDLELYREELEDYYRKRYSIYLTGLKIKQSN